MHGVTIRVIGQEDIYNHQVKSILTECLEQRGKLPEQNMVWTVWNIIVDIIKNQKYNRNLVLIELNNLFLGHVYHCIIIAVLEP